jgi:hypothetical protein
MDSVNPVYFLRGIYWEGQSILRRQLGWRQKREGEPYEQYINHGAHFLIFLYYFFTNFRDAELMQ